MIIGATHSIYAQLNTLNHKLKHKNNKNKINNLKELDKKINKL